MNKFRKISAGIACGALVLLPVVTPALNGLVNTAHAADDYLITASDTVPIFTATAAVGKQQFVQTANVSLPYYVGFMIALVVLLLALLPVKKIWGVIAGHFS